jgi:hypothetical protein
VNLGQTLITLAMFILLMMAVISANRMLVDNASSPLRTEALAASSMIASDLFAEIASKPYDYGVKGVIDTIYNNPVTHVIDTLWKQETTGLLTTTSFTSYKDTVHWGGWGVRRVLGMTLPDIANASGEFRSVKALKDVDDYDGYSRNVRYSDFNDVFTASVAVYYVTSLSPDVPDLATKQFLKRIVVTVVPPLSLAPVDTVVYKALSSY